MPEWEPSEDFIREYARRAKEKEERLAARKKAALEKARAVAELLKKKYGAEKVMLYGSLAGWSKFHERSDIDIMVWGFKGDFWRMQVEVEETALPFECTVVCQEDALPSLRERVLAKGVEL
ncbi:nucleotidyltransferase family protein [Ammonifex thiophilus]|nr:nucleotidyltransferase domain-containing protein [Ammonifex thiophilus]